MRRIVALYQLYRLMEIAGISKSMRRPTANIGALDGGFPSHTSILRSDVAISSLRNAFFTLSVLGNDHRQCHYRLKTHAGVPKSIVPQTAHVPQSILGV